jgi:hypothetical protein
MRIVKKREPNVFEGKQDRIMFCIYIHHEMRIVKKTEQNVFQGKQDRTLRDKLNYICPLGSSVR